MKNQSQLLKKLIKSNEFLEIPSQGFSMYPMISQNNVCAFEQFNLKKLNKGDILLFETKDGGLTGHRYLRTINLNGQIGFICKGDTNLYPDEPVFEGEVIGRLTLIKKSRTTIDVTKWFMKIYSLLLCHSRAASILLHIYVHKILKKRNGKAHEESSFS